MYRWISNYRTGKYLIQNKINMLDNEVLDLACSFADVECVRFLIDTFYLNPTSSSLEEAIKSSFMQRYPDESSEVKTYPSYTMVKFLVQKSPGLLDQYHINIAKGLQNCYEKYLDDNHNIIDFLESYNVCDNVIGNISENH